VIAINIYTTVEGIFLFFSKIFVQQLKEKVPNSEWISVFDTFVITGFVKMII